MKNTILLLYAILLFLSCRNEKQLQLPEIDKAEITELQDVSVAYLFYDETQPDSVLLNRRNLISTTNWLVNVDKRLTLKQAIPHIKLLQDKKKSSSHKNENAKNYFTCHDLSVNNLGFLEFTRTEYHQNIDSLFISKSKTPLKDYIQTLYISFESPKSIILWNSIDSTETKISKYSDVKDTIFKISKTNQRQINIEFGLSNELMFQDYINIKSILSKINLENVTLSKDEFIYN
ncbi:hypothetical protein MHTCC0001_22280 [Flavobacteriaceae bacterium MHTCC 0001]